MNTLMKFVLTMAISISIGASVPAFGQPKTEIVSIGQDQVEASFGVSKKSPNTQLPVKLSGVSIGTVVRLMTEDMKNDLPPNATNRPSAEAAAEILAKTFSERLLKSGVIKGQETETAKGDNVAKGVGVIELRLHFSNELGSKYKLLTLAKLDVNGELVIAPIVFQGNRSGVKEPKGFIEAAAVYMATGIEKNVVFQ